MISSWIIGEPKGGRQLIRIVELRGQLVSTPLCHNSYVLIPSTRTSCS